jgi:D-3-phosphoglycerate dehydrogenase
MPTVVFAHATPENAPVEMGVLNGAGEFDVVSHLSLETPEARAALTTCDALVVALNRVSAEMIDTMQHCKIIARLGTGYDTIDWKAAEQRGIWVTNVPDYSIDEVSTHALSLLLAQARKLKEHFALVDRGEWDYLQQTYPIRRLRGQTLGILGYGRIGSEMGRKGQGIGLRVIANDINVPPEQLRAMGAEPVDFDTLLQESDFLSLHVPLDDSTRRIINARALALMKPTAYLINTSRGEVVDTDALVEAVRNRQIAGAAIDVLPQEPPPPDWSVLHEPRILVTPHIAWASNEAAVDMRQRGMEEVVRAIRGDRPRTPVNDVKPERASV